MKCLRVPVTAENPATGLLRPSGRVLTSTPPPPPSTTPWTACGARRCREPQREMHTARLHPQCDDDASAVCLAYLPLSCRRHEARHVLRETAGRLRLGAGAGPKRPRLGYVGQHGFGRPAVSLPSLRLSRHRARIAVPDAR